MRVPLTSPGTGDQSEAVEVLPNDERDQRPVSARNGTECGRVMVYLEKGSTSNEHHDWAFHMPGTELRSPAHRHRSAGTHLTHLLDHESAPSPAVVAVGLLVPVAHLDGKTFANDEIVVALAVTMGGDKVFAGFVQTETENSRVITSFLRSLKDRGLDLSAGALVVIDGAKGLKSAVTTVFRGQVLIQRCQWHKRENVVSYLPRTEQKAWRGRLQRAYERPTYEEAKRDLKAMRGLSWTSSTSRRLRAWTKGSRRR